MVTNLVFKRTVNIEGSSRTEMKIIEVNIPEIKGNEGWTLVSSADKVTTVNLPKPESKEPVDITKNRDADTDKATDFLNNLIIGMNQATEAVNCNCAQTDEPALEKFKRQMAAQSVNVAYKPSEIREAEEVANIKEYPSPIDGTACLIRCKNNTIRIAYREGKKGNMNNPNRVCISNADKQHFFDAVRAANDGQDIITSWSLDKNSHHYNRWNKFIDDEYISQCKEYLRKERLKK